MNKKGLLAALLCGAVAVSAPAVADDESNEGYQYGPGYGMGPGMMGGYGPGAGMGPGAMHGRGPGAGMGPGPMYGYGPGAGRGPGMPGYGPQGGMAPGMMGPLGGLDLSEEQRKKILDIMSAQRQQQWERRARMQEEMAKLNRLYAQPKPDPEAVGKAYDEVSKAQREMIESRLRAHNRMYDVLTEEQRQQMRAFGWPPQP